MLIDRSLYAPGEMRELILRESRFLQNVEQNATRSSLPGFILHASIIAPWHDSSQVESLKRGLQPHPKRPKLPYRDGSRAGVGGIPDYLDGSGVAGAAGVESGAAGAADVGTGGAPALSATSI